MAQARQRVAILGGGVGAMTAAFALTSLPGARERYEVTVYQMGWRLGGKGASGRRAGAGQRIEEHGLHVWSGFYDNAIRLMKDCFAELGPGDATFTGFDAAFTPHNDIVLGEHDETGWKAWPIRPAMNGDIPGEGEVTLSPWGYFTLLSGYLRALLEGAPGDMGTRRAADFLPGHLADHLETRLGDADGTPLDLLHRLGQALPGDPAGHDRLDHAALDALARAAHADIRAGDRSAASDEIRRLAIMADLGGAALRGMIADEVFLKGFETIDGEEISDWLARHGAHPASVDSALVRAVYDYAFGYRQGRTDPAHKAIAAGTFLRGTLRLFLTYKGAIFFKMRAGMGDTIFTPLYKALKKRGVSFRFFHRVTGLHLDAAGKGIERIAIDRQAAVKDNTYRPFRRVKGLDCWPAEPLWDQIEGGTALAARGVDFEAARQPAPVEPLDLRRGRDFDHVVLGISLGALPGIAGELIAADPAWKRMVERVETVATQALQLWLRPTTAELGWSHGPSILTAHADDLNTWADLTHLEPVEDWPEADTPGSIAYFCGPLAEDATTPVSDLARDWVERHGGFIFPEAPGGIEAHLVGGTLPDGSPAGRYVRANTEGSERYVLSVPGSTPARLRADRSGFDNLWLAGDWTYTGINAGCVEAAAMSGLRAAAGLAGVPARIVGEDPDPDPGTGEPQAPPVLRSLRPQNAPWPWSSVYGMARTTGATVSLPVPAETALAMLPRGLALAPQSVTPEGTHPVILLFARQRDVRPNRLPFGISYNEFICAVPWVRHLDPALAALPPLICPTRLYLDSLPPILLGIWGYGFPKERAGIAAGLDSYVVRDPSSRAEIHAAGFSPSGPQRRAHDWPHFAAMRPAYEMAMVTRNRAGQWQYSVYDFSLGQALLQPLKMEIRIAQDRFGLPAGIHRPPSLTEAPTGAFFLTADATINNPLQSWQLLRRLRGAAP